MDATKKRYAVRMAPCSSYDVERMANWLENMAQRGYILDDTMGCLIIFRRDEPQKLRYRLCELPEESLFNDRDPSEVEELIAICEASGWHYVAKRGLFGIFATADETLPELQTEANPFYKRYIAFLLYTLIGSLAIALYPRQGFSNLTIQLLITVAVWLPLMFWGQAMPSYLNRIGNALFSAAVFIPIFWNSLGALAGDDIWSALGRSEYLIIVLFVLFVLFVNCYFIIGPLKFFYKMLRQHSLDYNKNWRSGTLCYRIATILVVVAYSYIFISPFYIFS